MGSVVNNPPLIVILGQTASGKSTLALDLAKRFDGEIIAADSRTVYKGMDIGTAKPSLKDQKLVPHHLIDVVSPDEPFTVADFQRLANAAIKDITARGKIPFLVGGSGLYIDAVIYNFSLRRAPGTDRATLQDLQPHELQALLKQQGIPLPENQDNARHLVRTLESGGEQPTKSDLRPSTLLIGIKKNPSELQMLIERRVDSMLAHGFLDEVKRLSLRYGWDLPAMQAPGYKDFRMYLAGQISLEEARRLFIQAHRQYAKRQKTWFKRNPDIHWISNPAEAVELVTTFLNK